MKREIEYVDPELQHIVIDGIKINVGDTVVCFKNDPLDDRMGQDLKYRWLVGDSFEVKEISNSVIGTFFHDGEGNNMSWKRAVKDLRVFRD